MSVQQIAAPLRADAGRPAADAPTGAAGIGRPSARALLVGLVLLAPLVGELLFRTTWRDGGLTLALAAAGYVAACAAFALLAHRPAELAWPPAARQWPRRAAIAGALLCCGAGLYVGSRDIRDFALLPLWLGGIALWVAAWAGPPARPHLSHRQWLLVGAVVLGAAALRLVGLETLQAGNHDEWITPDMAVSRTRREVGLPLFAHGKNDIGSLLMVSAYARRAVFDVFGISLTTMRAPSALLGVLGVGLVFAIGRMLFGFRVGIVAAAVLATMSADLAFSRRADPTIEGAIVWSAATLVLAYALLRRSVPALAIAGLTLSAAMYLYLSARPAIAYAVVALLVVGLDPRLRGRWLLHGAAAMVGGFVVGLGPLAVRLYENPSVFAHDSGHVAWLFEAVNRFLASGRPADLLPLWQHFGGAVLSYSVVGGRSTHYVTDRGLFEAPLAWLMFAGAALATFRLRDWRYRLIALWFWSATFSLSALSSTAPAVHRGQPAFPAAALLIAIALDRVIAHWSQLGALARRGAPVAAAALLVPALALQVSLYFDEFAKRDFEFWMSQLGRYLLAQPEGRHVVVVTNGDEHLDFVLAVSSNAEQRLTHEHLHRLVDWPGQPPAGATGMTFVFHRNAESWLGQVEALFPGGRHGELRSPDPSVPFAPLWYTYEVGAGAAAEVGSPRLAVEWLSPDGTLRRREPDVQVADHALNLRAPARGPLLVRWRGTLALPRDERVELELRTDEPARLLVDGQQVWPQTGEWRRWPLPAGERPSVALRLAQGGHEVVVERAHERGRRISLLWHRQGRVTVVPISAFEVLPWP